LHKTPLKNDLLWYVSLLAVIAIVCPILAGLGVPQVLWLSLMMAAGAGGAYRMYRIGEYHVIPWMLRMATKAAEAVGRRWARSQ
jgi:hypothetical protein